MLPNEYREDDSLGVRHDTLADALMALDGAEYSLEDINVQLDSLADDHSIWTADERKAIRDAQRTVQALLSAKREDMEEVGEKLDAIRDDKSDQ